MALVLVRIDNRLIHGQVLEAWIPFTHASCIAVANDDLAKGSLRRIMMEASVPRGLRVVIGSVDEVCHALADHELDKENILLLFANSRDALRAYRNGLLFRQLNLGNMHEGSGTVQLSCTIHLDDQDVHNLKCLEDDGVEIVSRCVPSDRARPWRKLTRNLPD